MTISIEPTTSSLLGTYKRAPAQFVDGEGVYLIDADGKRYLDFVSGIAVNAFGYGDAGLKQAMHELTGVPVQALGQLQPISNTSGVAVALQYQPLMLKHERKKVQYVPLFDHINNLVIKHAFLFEPDLLVYNPFKAGVMLKPDQYPQLDPEDPVSYVTYTDWPSPMPMDTLIKINEAQAKMAMGLESKRGALRDLGTQFPDQKMREIFEELLEDTKEQGALDLIRMQIQAFTTMATGMTPDGVPLMTADAEGNPQPVTPNVDPAMAQDLMQMAYQQMPPQRADLESDQG